LETRGQTATQPPDVRHEAADIVHNDRISISQGSNQISSIDALFTTDRSTTSDLEPTGRCRTVVVLTVNGSGQTDDAIVEWKRGRSIEQLGNRQQALKPRGVSPCQMQMVVTDDLIDEAFRIDPRHDMGQNAARCGWLQIGTIRTICIHCSPFSPIESVSPRADGHVMAGRWRLHHTIANGRATYPTLSSRAGRCRRITGG
jgi:hypothetical protein